VTGVQTCALPIYRELAQQDKSFDSIRKTDAFKKAIVTPAPQPGADARTKDR
jgi:hypothetical protein